jgi:hypothetical protein
MKTFPDGGYMMEVNDEGRFYLQHHETRLKIEGVHP